MRAYNQSAGMYDMEAIHRTIALLQTITQQVPADHGLSHLMAVYTHALRATNAVPYGYWNTTSMLLAALLHDIDDRKVNIPYRQATGRYPKAIAILEDVGLKRYTSSVIEMISLVATSENGNAITQPLYMYIPRDADRIEALGHIGIARCLAYAKRVGNPLYVAETPLFSDLKALQAYINTRSLDEYVTAGGKSRSVIDHFYDKLLHLGTSSSKNPYMHAQITARMQMMYQWVVQTSLIILQHKDDSPLTNLSTT
jgi:uncharacterized protein